MMNMGVTIYGKTHCRLLPHVTDFLHGDVLFSKRFLKHCITGYCNKNSRSMLFLDHQCAMYLGLVGFKMILTYIVYIECP